MKNSKSLHSLAIFTTLFVVTLPSPTQTIRFDWDAKTGGGYHLLWDSTQDVLLAVRDVTSPDAVAVRIFHNDGGNTAIYPLRDFPGATEFDIWSAAATPEQGIVLAATVPYGKPVKSMILTYGKNGNLEKIWEVSPYQHSLIASDADGNVFAVGNRLDRGKDAYPMLIVYSPSGEMLAQTLSTKLFQRGDEVIISPSSTGESALFMRGKEAILWLATTKELFRVSAAGEILQRTSLARPLEEIKKQLGAEYLTVRSLRVAESNEIVMQLLLTAKTKVPAQFVLARVGGDFSHASLQSVDQKPAPGEMMGITSNGNLVFLEKDSQGTFVKVE